nr:MAG TPA: hypothetical protein [Caudoviricetes sp.]
MKNARLIIGIVSFILFFIILFQSCVAGFVNSVNASSDAGGSVGLVVAFMVVIAGIIAIVCRKNATGSIVAGVVYGLSGLLGVANSDVYKDTCLFGAACSLFSLFSTFSLESNKRKAIKQICNHQITK